MKKFVSFIINILIKLFIFLIMFVLCFIAFMFLTSKFIDISVSDTIGHFKDLASDITNTSINNSSSNININLNTNSNISKSNNISLVSSNNKFYYEQLDDENSKLIYDALEKNISNFKKDNYIIDFSTTFNKLLNSHSGEQVLNRAFQTALDAFFYDHPELFYIDLTKITLSIKSVSVGPITTYTVKLAPQNGTNYLHKGFYSEEDVNTAVSKVENIKKNIISSIYATDDYTKALKVHDTLVDLIKYDSTCSKNNTRNIYGALIDKCVVCEGYAKSFKYILDSLGIQCILVSGEATNSSGKTENHMWNYIKLDEKWYGVDATWDDPIVIGGFSKDIIKHDYFCKGSATFDKSHSVNSKISDNGKRFLLPTLSYKNYK